MSQTQYLNNTMVYQELILWASPLLDIDIGNIYFEKH